MRPEDLCRRDTDFITNSGVERFISGLEWFKKLSIISQQETRRVLEILNQLRWPFGDIVRTEEELFSPVLISQVEARRQQILTCLTSFKTEERNWLEACREANSHLVSGVAVDSEEPEIFIRRKAWEEISGRFAWGSISPFFLTENLRSSAKKVKSRKSGISETHRRDVASLLIQTAKYSLLWAINFDRNQSDNLPLHFLDLYELGAVTVYYDYVKVAEEEKVSGFIVEFPLRFIGKQGVFHAGLLLGDQPVTPRSLIDTWHRKDKCFRYDIDYLVEVSFSSLKTTFKR